MKFTKLMAVVLSLAIAATAMFTSAFAVTINGTVEEGDVTGIVIDLGADYPVLLDAASWAAGVEVDFTYDFENEIVEVAEGYGNGCGGNAGLYIKYGEAYSWKDKNNWSYDVNWMADKALECNTAVLQFDTEGAAIMEAGFRIYNFQQAADGDLDSQLVGNGITVEILDIRVGGESILGDAPVVDTDAPVDTDVATDVPVDTDVATDAPVDTDVTTDAPVVEVPEGAYIKATVDAAAGKVTLSTVNFPEEIYGLQYTLDFTGATYAGMEKGKLPSGWSETYPKDADIATGFTAALDCDFSTVLADQDILVINFTDAADIEVAISGAKAVNGAFQGVEVASYVEYVEAEEPTDTDVPVDTETDVPVDTDVTTDAPADTNTEVKGDEPSTGGVDTGVVGFASILGVVALAGAVASKKR